MPEAVLGKHPQPRCFQQLETVVPSQLLELLKSILRRAQVFGERISDQIARYAFIFRTRLNVPVSMLFVRAPPLSLQKFKAVVLGQLLQGLKSVSNCDGSVLHHSTLKLVNRAAFR